MKNLTRYLLIVLMAAGLSACVEESDPNPEKDMNTTCQGTECEPDPELNPVMKGAYISAHLGNYWSCPEDGYTATGAGLDEPASAPAERSSGVSSDCAPGADSCGAPLNCEDAQFSLSLTNSGQVGAVGVTISKLELLNSTGSVGTLPVGEVIDTATGNPFDGEVEAGESVNLRVDFMGPADPYQMLDNEQTADLEATVESDNHDEIKIRGEDIAALPAIAT